MTNESATVTMGASAGELVGMTPSPACAAASVPYRDAHPSTRESWVLSPVQDTLLIIAAPLLTLALALFSMYWFGAVKGATLVLLTHVVFTVAHHLPTFIRIYGDLELARRYNWHFIFAPVISLSFALGVLTWLNLNGYPLEHFLYFYILLTLWDPWHFMRQHYGFMRIYDRHNQAPRLLASRMDLLLSMTWFAYIMAASGDWLLDLLQDMYTRVQWPLLLTLSSGGMTLLVATLRNLAFLTTAAYLCYLLWCWRKGYFISMAKMLMCATTFGVMYLTYTPNALIQSLAPEWSFKVGFAVIGVVHMTQYLAIVWRFNRGLAQRPQRARAGVFHWLHSRGAWWAAGVYVLVCLWYGDVITTVHDNQWLMAALLAIGFTSTMMHYYFDGFIWKVRHRQNQEALSMNAGSDTHQSSPTQRIESWWSSFQPTSAIAVLSKQLLYFAVPLTLLTLGAMTVWGKATGHYVEHMYQAQALSTQGQSVAAAQQAQLAFQAMQEQLPLAAKLAELQPTASRHAELAFLIYNESLYRNRIMPALAGMPATDMQLLQHRARVQAAIELLSQAIADGGVLAHAGREQFTVEDARSILMSWQKQIGQVG